MEKILKIITLAAATILLLGSCSQINERLDNLEKQINGIENETIKDIDGQISSINSSIADLGSIRSSIQSLTSTVGTQGGDIEDLKSADEALGGRIDELNNFVNGELANYAKNEWVEATFLTLKEYEKTCDTIARIDVKIGDLDTRLSGEIASTADSLKSWINVQFGSYYTAAQMDAKLDVLQAAIDSAKAENKAQADSIAAELTEAKAAVDSAKANIRAEYRAAIDTAITALDGKLSKALQDSILAVNNKIDHLTGWVKALDQAVYALIGRVEKLEKMIQSVSIIPAYSDGSVEGFGSILKIKCVVEPADAVEKISKDDIIVLISEVKTKAVKFDTVAVSKLELDKTTGEINIKADISSIPPVPDGKTLMAALEITIGPSNYITGFYPVYSGANVSVTTTEDGAPKIGISSDPDFEDVVISGEIPVESFFEESKSTTIEVEGFGTITFDENAASKIKENANGATNILIKVEDITNTLANPVPEADVVLEVTMKAVDEAGTEVFSEDKAAGTVTIEIPVDPEVVFVKNVTLVDDDGVVIENGVDPETIKLDLEKHLLSFEVKHFSKYAVGYVKKDDFVSVTGVTLDTNKLTIAVGGTETLTATIDPNDATNKKVTWTSNNPDVATVDKNGKVTAVAKGEAKIIVTTEDVVKSTGKAASDTCIVSVVVPVTGVSLNKTSITLAVGGTETLTATVAPGDADNKDMSWSSSDEAVATVDPSGKVTAVAHGTATITVTTEDGSKTATCTVTVTTGASFKEYEEGGNI